MTSFLDMKKGSEVYTTCNIKAGDKVYVTRTRYNGGSDGTGKWCPVVIVGRKYLHVKLEGWHRTATKFEIESGDEVVTLGAPGWEIWWTKEHFTEFWHRGEMLKKLTRQNLEKLSTVQLLAIGGWLDEREKNDEG